jgi:hypothetical protein
VAPSGRDRDPHEVSDVPLRERLDPTAKAGRGARPPPPRWPEEAIGYPWRGRGWLSLPLAAAVLAGADAATRANAFLGAVAKVFLYAWLLAWQRRAAAATALGEDRPPRAWDASDLEAASVAALGTVGFRFLLYLAPAVLALVIPWLRDPATGPGRTDFVWAGVFAGAGLVFAVVALLGTAVDNRSMTWPWGALPWILRGWRAVLLALAGWAAQVGAEAFVASGHGDFAALLAVRVGSTWLLLIGGRALGVLARRYAL